MKKLHIWFILTVMLVTTGCSIRVSHLFSDSDSLTLKGNIENTIITATSTVSGQIIETEKKQGEPVKKGDVIAVIKHEDQEYTVKQLEAIVNMKKATIEELQAGARPQQIKQVQAQVNAAKAKLAELQAGTRPQQIEQAQAQVRAAKAQYELVASGNEEEQIKQAKNSVSIAEEALNAQQITFNHINEKYQNTLSLHNEGMVSKNELDNVKYELDIAKKQLSTLEFQLNSSKQQLSLLEKGVPLEESVATANYDAAKAQLKLLQNGPTEQSIRVAQAEVDQATAQLELLKSGSTKQALDAAQADLDQAVAQLEQAQTKLDSYYIRALEDGIIISKNFELGDVVNIGSQIADIATNDTYVLVYLPIEYLDKVFYSQSISVKTAVGNQEGIVSYIDLESEYTPKDKRSTTESEPIATKVKVAIDNEKGKLKSGMTAEIYLPLK